MSKTINVPGRNEVSITGTLHNVVMREGTTKPEKGAKPYRSGTITVRVNQHYGANGGVDEVSEIPVEFIAMKFKKDGTINSAWERLGDFLENGPFKSIQQVGLDRASRIRVPAKFATLNENMYSPDGETIRTTWRISSSFFNQMRGTGEPGTANADAATFCMDVFLMTMDREVSSEGEETGRLHIRGAVVQYGQRLDVLDFYVENPSAIDFIERNYNVNDTVNLVGRIRYTSATEEIHEESSWGEVIPKTTTRYKHELIVVNGSDAPYEDEMAYDPTDIATLNADRQGRREQIKIDYRNSKAAKAAAKAPVASAAETYDWE